MESMGVQMGVKGGGVYLKKVDARSVKQKEGFVLKVSAPHPYLFHQEENK